MPNYMNGYFPVGYQPAQVVYPQQYQPQQIQNQQMQTAQAQASAIQQSGFVRVPSENDARMYPVAPGNSVTFIDDNAPYCYVKTMDISQLDRPRFEKYRLVKEEDPPAASQIAQNASNASEGNNTTYAEKSDLEAIWSEIDSIKEKMRSTRKGKHEEFRAEVDEDE